MLPYIVSTSLVGLQLSITGAVVGLTNPNSSLRILGLPATLFAATLQLSSIDQLSYPIARAFLGSASVFLVVLYIDAALLSRWTFETRGLTSSLDGQNPTKTRHPEELRRPTAGLTQETTQVKDIKLGSFYQRLRFGFTISLQSRFPGTQWAVKNIPPFSRNDPGYVPTKSEFIARGILKCCIYMYILRLSSELGDPKQNPVLFSSERIPLFRRLNDVSIEELETRFLGTLGYWTVQYLVIEVLYSLLAVSAVSMNVTEVDVWPPAFGSIDEAWSLRQFWGSFYHQFIRRGCSSVAHFVTYRCLDLKRGGLMARYIFTINVFTVSGIFHALSDVAQGIPMSESGALSFFCMQAMGIMFEDAVQAIWRRGVDTKALTNLRYVPLHTCTRVFGYLWVVVWLAWASPIWIYPAMQRDTGTPIVPF